MLATPEFNNYTNFMPERLFIKKYIKNKICIKRFCDGIYMS